MDESRRELLKRGATALAAAAATGVAGSAADLARAQATAAGNSSGAITVDPAPLYEVSPHLYMQFMEPLGTTDSSVEAAWSYDADTWRRDFVEATADLAPPMLRYGGLLSRYYKWREGVGPADRRPMFRNYLWGGKETHRVGTHEFVALCRQVKADPMYCVNFLADGRLYFGNMKEGNRLGDAKEAADWVAYCNDADHPQRKANGAAEPLDIKYWQLGNETNYGPGGFTLQQTIHHTIEFARAMRARDKSIKLIGWGDEGGGRNDEPWAGPLAKAAGERVDYVAFHMMQQSPIRKDSVLHDLRYQAAPREAWDELMEMVGRVEQKLVRMEQSLDAVGSKHPLAVTEGHLSIRPRNASPLLTEWLTGVHAARVMNVYHRHGGRVKIATHADFCGNRWTSNALMIQVPTGVSYLLPAGAVMRLYRHHNGTHGVAFRSTAPSLDIAASRAGDRVFLHIANADYASPVDATFAVTGMAVTAGRVFSIAPDDPRQAITEDTSKVFDPKEHPLPAGPEVKWRFPARSVSAVELTCKPA